MIHRSIFQTDDTLGAAYGSAVFTATIEAGGMVTQWQLESIITDLLTANGWGVRSVSAVSAGTFSAFWNVTITLIALCGQSVQTMVNGIAGSLAPRYGAITVRHRSTSGCPIGQEAAGNAYPSQIYNAGNLATVTVSAGGWGDNTPAQTTGSVNGNGTGTGLDMNGWLTWAENNKWLLLAGLAAFAVIKNR
jgi:hypothetical protein